MIEKLLIGNFKGFRDTREINLAPLNFIFGQNSSGKSAIIHSLAFLNQSRKSHDTDEIFNFFGPFIDLGGFKNTIFGHTTDEEITIGIQVDVNKKETDLNDYREIFQTIFDSVKIEFDIAWNPSSNKSYLKSFVIELIGEENISLIFDRILNPDELSLVIRGETGFNLASKLVEIYNLVDKYGSIKQTDYFGPNLPISKYRNYFRKFKISDIALELQKSVAERALSITNEKDIIFLSSMQFYPENVKNNSLKKDGIRYSALFVNQLLYFAFQNLGESALGFKHIGPLRPNPERIYQNDSDGANMVKKLLNNESLLDVLNSSLENLDIPYKVKVQKIVSDYSSAGEYMALSFVDKRTNTEISGKDLGFGVSQILPIIYESFNMLFGEDNVLMIEQPELHLHPRLQLNLANFFVDMLKVQNNDQPTQLIVETHSENLILRMQNLVKQGVLSPDQIQIIYVGSNENTGSWHKEIKLLPDGQLADEWPGGFFTERLEEWGL
jgi:AAA15 family ATPase/GTPase